MALLHYYVRRVNFTKFQALFLSKNSLYMHSLSMGNFATLQLLQAASSVTNPDFFWTVYFCYTNRFFVHTKPVNPLTEAASFWKRFLAWIFFFDPTDLVNSFGRLKTGNFLTQQRPKLASKLKWKMTALPSAYLHLLDTARLTLDFLQVDLW